LQCHASGSRLVPIQGKINEGRNPEPPGQLRKTIAGHCAIVVEAQECDHVAQVGLVLDATGGRPLRIGEHGVRNDSALLPEIGPYLLGETEVGRAVAVQVTDLPTAELEGQLAQIARCRMDARPGRDLCDDLVAHRSCRRHERAPFESAGWTRQATSSSKLEVKARARILSPMPPMPTRGRVWRRSGVASSAIRFYEQRGLMRSERAGSGHRRYPQAVLRRIAFIVFAQRIGLTLDEIGAELAKLPAAGVPTGRDWSRLSSESTSPIDHPTSHHSPTNHPLPLCIR